MHKLLQKNTCLIFLFSFTSKKSGRRRVNIMDNRNRNFSVKKTVKEKKPFRDADQTTFLLLSPALAFTAVLHFISQSWLLVYSNPRRLGFLSPLIWTFLHQCFFIDVIRMCLFDIEHQSICHTTWSNLFWRLLTASLPLMASNQQSKQEVKSVKVWYCWKIRMVLSSIKILFIHLFIYFYIFFLFFRKDPEDVISFWSKAEWFSLKTRLKTSTSCVI